MKMQASSSDTKELTKYGHKIKKSDTCAAGPCLLAAAAACLTPKVEDIINVVAARGTGAPLRRRCCRCEPGECEDEQQDREAGSSSNHRLSAVLGLRKYSISISLRKKHKEYGHNKIRPQ